MSKHRGDPCLVPGCESNTYDRDMCSKHRRRIRLYGDVNGTVRVDPIERFWSKIDVRGDDECWPWTAAVTQWGYGRLVVTRTNPYTQDYAHRFAYELLVGPIPKSLTLDHLCHTRDTSCPGGTTCPHRRCVNPAHMEPVSFAENVSRGRHPRKVA